MLISMLAVLCTNRQAYADDQGFDAATGTFSASVIAQEPIEPANPPVIRQLGQHQQCRVTHADKQATPTAACYLYRDAQDYWYVEQVDAVCYTTCQDQTPE